MPSNIESLRKQVEAELGLSARGLRNPEVVAIRDEIVASRLKSQTPQAIQPEATEESGGIGDWILEASKGFMAATSLAPSTASFVGNTISDDFDSTAVGGAVRSASDFFERGQDAATDMQSDAFKAKVSQPIYNDATGEWQMPNATQVGATVLTALPQVPMLFAGAGAVGAATAPLRLAPRAYKLAKLAGAGSKSALALSRLAPNMLTYGTAGSLMGAGDTFSETHGEVMAALKDQDMTDEQKQRVANTLSKEAAIRQMPIAAVMNAVGLGSAASAVGPLWKKMALGAAVDIPTEIGEEGAQGLNVNLSTQKVDPTRDIWAGVRTRAALGGIAGGVMGGGIAGLTHAGEKQAALDQEESKRRKRAQAIRQVTAEANVSADDILSGKHQSATAGGLMQPIGAAATAQETGSALEVGSEAPRATITPPKEGRTQQATQAWQHAEVAVALAADATEKMEELVPGWGELDDAAKSKVIDAVVDAGEETQTTEKGEIVRQWAELQAAALAAIQAAQAEDAKPATIQEEAAAIEQAATVSTDQTAAGDSQVPAKDLQSDVDALAAEEASRGKKALSTDQVQLYELMDEIKYAEDRGVANRAIKRALKGGLLTESEAAHFSSVKVPLGELSVVVGSTISARQRESAAPTKQDATAKRIDEPWDRDLKTKITEIADGRFSVEINAPISRKHFLAGASPSNGGGDYYGTYATREAAEAEVARRVEKHTKDLQADRIAHEADRIAKPAAEPTDAQKEAGNYKKEHLRMHGLEIAIENRRGSTRSGTDEDGNEWSNEMAHDYGYIKRTEGNDGDHLDVFVGPDEASTKVYIVNQKRADGSFDEHKVMLGFASAQAAEEGYLANYDEGWSQYDKDLAEMSVDDFKAWLKDGDQTKPAKSQNSTAREQELLERIRAQRPQGPTIQNRDRGRAASVAQMQSIGNAPDYALVGPSRSPESGAPMVFIKGDVEGAIPEEQYGKADYVRMGDGRRIEVRYAVVDASKVLASHRADGTRVEAFSSPSEGDLVALNNGRTAGIQAAHQRDTATKYTDELVGDFAGHGIDMDVIFGVENPMLVRVYSEKENTDNIGDLSNAKQGLGMSATEKAQNDARLLEHLDDLNVGEDGITASNNMPIIRRFLRELPNAEAGEYLMDDGSPNKALIDRLQAAVFQMAYRDHNLTALVAEATDQEIANILKALLSAAPRFARLGDDIPVPVPYLIAQAAQTVRHARAAKLKVKEYLGQQDMFGRDTSADSLALFLSENNRSVRRMSEALGKLAEYLEDEVRAAGSQEMFGDTRPQASMASAIDHANRYMIEAYGNETIQPGFKPSSDLFGANPPKLESGEGRPISDVAGGLPDGSGQSGGEQGAEAEAADEAEVAAGVAVRVSDVKVSGSKELQFYRRKFAEDGRQYGLTGPVEGWVTIHKVKVGDVSASGTWWEVRAADYAGQKVGTFAPVVTLAQFANNKRKDAEAFAFALMDSAQLDEKTGAVYIKNTKKGGEIHVVNIHRELGGNEQRLIDAHKALREQFPAEVKLSKEERARYIDKLQAAPEGSSVTLDGKQYVKGKTNWIENGAATGRSLVSSFFVDRGVRDFESPKAAPAKNPQPGQKLLGKNHRGHNVYEDENGIRSYVEQGIRVQETVKITPTGFSRGELKKDFKTVEELAAEGKPSEASKKIGDDVRAYAKDAGRKKAAGIFDWTSKQSTKASVEAEILNAIYAKYQTEGDEAAEVAKVILAELIAEDAKPAAPSSQFLNYEKWIKEGNVVSRGMRETIETDERLNDGESARLLAMAAENDAKPTPAPAKKPIEVSANTVFTDDAAAKALEILRKKLKGNQLNSGIDPELMQAGITLAGYHIEKGARTFAAYTKAMIDQLGEEVIPYLKSWYMGVKYDPRAAGFEGMDGAATVEAAVVLYHGSDNGKNSPAAAGGADNERAGEGPAEQPGQGEGQENPRGRGVRRAPAGADAQVVAADAAEDVGGADQAGAGGGSGAGAAVGNVRGGENVSGQRNGSDGRQGAGGAGVAAAGAGERGDGRSDGSDTGDVTPKNQRANYHIADPEALIGGTPKVRFARNKKAIEAFNAIRAEGREPTQDELDAMAGYIGWGSFGQELFQGSFDKPKPKDGWAKESDWLREHLGKEAWDSAQRSIINAHYTDPVTVAAMWDMVRKLGFKGGRVLEPSMGVGNFYGLMPRDLMERSKLTGIEMDTTTGGMAQLLYPDANIQIKPYQDSQTADGFYDLVIGNWPFAADGPVDRRYMHLSPSLHDYFFLKALDQVREGGIVIGITSAGSMDKKGTIVRAALAEKADLVGAFRLPSGAFEKYAGTSVVTDIIILKKRAESNPNAREAGWLKSNELKFPAGTISVNEYFLGNPRHVLGRLDVGHGTTYGRAGMIVHRPDDIEQRINALTDLLPANVITDRMKVDNTRYVTNNTKDRERAIVESNGDLYVVSGERLALLNDVHKFALKDAAKTGERKAQIAALVNMRKAYGELIDAERDGKPDTEQKRKELARQYQDFTKNNGPIRDSYALGVFRKVRDPFFASLAALEDGKGNPATILSRATVRTSRKVENPTVADALVIARNESMNIDMARIAELSKVPEEQAAATLMAAGQVFKTPAGNYEVRDVYLSGNVRRKLREAKAAQEQGEDMARNIEELQAVLPKDVPYFNIEAKLGATWVRPEQYQEFVSHLLGVKVEPADLDVRFSANRWKVRIHRRSLVQRPEATTTWGHPDIYFDRLLTHAMGNLAITINRRDEDGNKVVDEQASKEANEKAQRVREEFSEWLWRDAARRIEMEQTYNEIMNAIAIPQFDGSFMAMDGMALQRGDSQFSLRSHQVNAIWRGLANGRGIYAHEVGTGKTYTMGGLAVESRRYGVAKKPLIFAHNANSASVAAEIQEMYPGAKLLYIDNLAPESIDITMRQIANDDWDAIIVPHSLINRFTLKRETLMEIAREEIEAIEQEAIEEAAGDGITLTASMMDSPDDMKRVRNHTAKSLVHQRNAIIAKIEEMALKSSREGAVSFEDMGIDMVIVDEAHQFKKPPIATRMQMRGLNTKTSAQSLSLSLLSSYVRRSNNGRGVHLFTGTPITNTLTEIFNMQRYVMDDIMARDGLKQWDAWFNTFADSTSDVELTASGEYEPVTRLASFVNVAELRRMIGQFLDIVFADDMPEFTPRTTDSGKTIKSQDLTDAERDWLANGRSEKPIGRPYKKVIADTAEMTPDQASILAELQRRSAIYRNATKRGRYEMRIAGSPNLPVIVETASANAGLDARLYDAEATDAPTNKVNRVTNNIIKHYKEHPLATQVVFSEIGYTDVSVSRRRDRDTGEVTTRRTERFNLVANLIDKLVAAGIPRGQIAVVDGKVSKEDRKKIAAAMNEGSVRVVIGSSDTLGVGVNMQANLRAMHHLDAPWMPGELEQRNGRGHRQGNKWNTVLEYRYITERIDGRRWQVLAVKDRFIKAFLKADESVRVIEGDAVSMDEDGDIGATLSEAAGDPRILLLNKLSADILKLENKERMHSQGIYDATQQARSLKRRADEAIAHSVAMQADSDTFRAAIEQPLDLKINGVSYDDAGEANAALDDIKKRIQPSSRWIDVGSMWGFDVSIRWSAMTMPLEVQAVGKAFHYPGRLSVESIRQTLYGTAERAKKLRQQSVEAAGSIARMEEAANAPFARADDLAKKRKMHADLELDLQANPIPAPGWLRNGAPVGTLVFVDGAEHVVEGHRWTAIGYRVTVTDRNGNTSDVDYDLVKDDNGMPKYEVMPFAPPKVAAQTEPQQPAGEDGPRFKQRKQADASSRARFIDEPDLSFRLASPTGKGMSASDVKLLVSTIMGKWRNRPPIIIVQSEADLANHEFGDEILAAINDEGASGQIPGVYYKGRVFLIADKMRNGTDVAVTLAHEVVGHHGLRELLGADEHAKLMDSIYLAYGKDALIRALPDYDFDGMDWSNRSVRRKAADELVAKLAEDRIRPKVLRMIYARIRQWIRDNFPRVADAVNLRITDEDIRALVARAADRLREVPQSVRDNQAALNKKFPQGPRYSQINGRSARWYYSPLTQAVEKIRDEKMPAARWMNKIKDAGVKAEEIEFSGIGDFLAKNAARSLTKEEVLGAALQNEVQVQEVMLGKTDQYDYSRIYEIAAAHEISVVDDMDGGQYFEDEDGEPIDYEDLPDDLKAALVKKEGAAGIERVDGESKHAQWQLPGGKNYRELLLTLPRKTPRKMKYAVVGQFPQGSFDTREAAQARIDELMANINGNEEIKRAIGPQLERNPLRIHEYEEEASRAHDYRTGHWDEPNVLAHIRFNERAGANGERVLHIEEIQSDWHQAGRKQGYQTPDNVGMRNGDGSPMGVPDAPFKETGAWALLAMKRMIAYASANGFDAITWTGGEAQAERYDLSKEIKSLDTSRNKSNGTWAIYAENEHGELLYENAAVPDDELPKIVGEEIAAKIIASGDGITLKGLDLKIGGKGMIAFYDKILPEKVGGFIKKFGGKVERITGQVAGAFDKYEAIENGAVVWTFDGLSSARRWESEGEGRSTRPVGADQAFTGFRLTPKLREAAQAGLPLFHRSKPGVGQSPDGVARPDGEGVGYKHEIRPLEQLLLDANSSLRLHHGGSGGVVPQEWTQPSRYAGERGGQGGAAVQGATSARAGREEQARLIAAAKEHGFFLGLGHPIFEALEAYKNEGGEEHDAYIVGDAPNQVVIRQTVRGEFGNTSQHSPVEYLKRLEAYNQTFPHLQTRMIGVHEDADGNVSILTAQQFVKGEEFASQRELDAAMRANGWFTFGMNDYEYRHRETGAVIEDAHTGNVLHIGNELFPIDVIVQKKTDESQGGGPRFRRVRDADPEAGRQFVLAEESLTDAFIRRIQDKFLRVKKVQRAIQDAYGENAIPDHLDVYRGEELSHGRAETILREFEEEHVKPLVQAMSEAGVDRMSLDTFLYARHAAERNDHIAEINPDFPDGGSGMSTEAAEEILSSHREDGSFDKMAALADRVYAINAARTKVMLETGLATEEEVAAWTDYQFYVPLKGNANNVGWMRKIGQGFSVKGKESKQALGRRSRAESPLLHSIAQMEQTLLRAEKNRVGLRFQRLVKSFPNPDLWEVVTAHTDMVRRYNQQTREVEYVPNNQLRNEPDVFTLKEDGKEKYIRVHDERLLAAMKNLGPEPLDALARALGWVNRKLAAVNTSLNPEFVISNFARDLQTALANLDTEADRPDGRLPQKVTARVLKDIPKAMRGIYHALRETDGRESEEWVKHFNEFREYGGQIGYFGMADFETKAAELQQMLDEANGDWKALGKKGARALWEWISDANSSIENAVRLSAYVNARRVGVSRERAASLAKNLTVNFNRKGELGTLINSFYLFANASIQGTAQLARVVSSRKGKYVVTGIAAGALILAEINRIIGGDDDDEENFYAKVPDHIKERNIVLMKWWRDDGSYMTFPLPYGYNIFHAAGNGVSDLIHGRPVSEVSVGVAGVLVGAFSPLGAESSDNAATFMAKLAAPTILDPAVQLAVNENFTGQPIYNEGYAYGTPRPDSSLFWRGTGDVAKFIASELNAVTGGSHYRSGWADVSPDAVEHLFDFGTGGAGAFWRRAWTAGEKLAAGEELPPNLVPFSRRVSGQVDDRQDIGRYYDRRDELKQLEDEFEAARKESPEAAQAWREEHGNKIPLFAIAKGTERALREKRDLRKRIEQRSGVPEEMKRKRLKQLDDEIRVIVDRFNKEYGRAVNPP